MISRFDDADVRPVRRLVHFMLPLLTCSGTYIALAQLEIVPHPGRPGLRRHTLGVFLITFLIGLGFAALYEIYEASADWILDNDPPLQDSLVRHEHRPALRRSRVKRRRRAGRLLGAPALGHYAPRPA